MCTQYQAEYPFIREDTEALAWIVGPVEPLGKTGRSQGHLADWLVGWMTREDLILAKKNALVMLTASPNAPGSGW